MTHSTKERLLQAGLHLLLKRGYHNLGITALLEETDTPKGSFYHHFDSKKDFTLQVIERYMDEVHEGLDACLEDSEDPPLQRVRSFFEATREKYRSEGYLGCMLGGLGQELSGVNEEFRQKIDDCLAEISRRVAGSLEQARQQGDLPADADVRQMADRLVDCWEGAALRSRLAREPAPLDDMLEFYFGRIIGT